jgi:hypothetical protein
MVMRKASQLYKEGRFNAARVQPQPDGSVRYTCDGPLAPRPYTFRARNFLTPEEDIIEDEDVEVPEE